METQKEKRWSTSGCYYIFINALNLALITWPTEQGLICWPFIFPPNRLTWKVYLHLTRTWLQMKKYPPVQRLRPLRRQRVWRSTRLQRCASLWVHVWTWEFVTFVSNVVNFMQYNHSTSTFVVFSSFSCTSLCLVGQPDPARKQTTWGCGTWRT